jgi:XRE family aerobic/anaerobic benzoate catabolism transcriptional regulator
VLTKDSINVKIFEFLSSQKHVFSVFLALRQKVHYNALFVLQGLSVCIIMHFRGQKSRIMSTQQALPNPLSDTNKPKNGDEIFLSNVATSFRAARARCGMTRKQLSHESGVSERLLAQLEMGEGNITIVLLRRIANALNISLADLFMDAREPHPEKRFIQNLLERLPVQRLQEVAQKLTREFGEDVKLRWSRLALIGLRGAGKSTLGAKIAKEFKAPFVELDAEIEKDAGIPLAEIFSLYGQSGYRRIERRTLERVLQSNDRVVISVGGGVVSEKENYDYLLKNCFTIWIKAQPDEHMARVIAQGDFRAMADNNEAMEDLRRILEAREPFYEKADGVVDTSGESVEKSLAKLKAVIQSVAKKMKSETKSNAPSESKVHSKSKSRPKSKPSLKSKRKSK